MRAAAPKGLYVGGYGWVENLRPAPAARAGDAARRRSRRRSSRTPNDSGFIHAPSLTHAAAAALLRNAHLGRRHTAQPSGPFAIDLSSRRVREAAQLLDGVRQGQPLGALLGYRFERGLHELGARSLRRRAARPRAARRRQARADTTLPAEAIAANNVVDGLVLQRKWSRRAGQRDRGAATQPTAGRAGRDRQGTRRPRRLVDALSDALTAETAYQMARGNTLAHRGTLSAIAQGDAPAPELEVCARRAAASRSRIGCWCCSAGRRPRRTGWAAASTSPRATAEPMLNAWAATAARRPAQGALHGRARRCRRARSSR